jgi:hypothetical protein
MKTVEKVSGTRSCSKKRRSKAMKRGWMFLVMVAVFGFPVMAKADLMVIGTATYLGSNYNLIYEDNQHLVWLDYTKYPVGPDNWQSQANWASGLGVSLAVNLKPGYTTTIDWSSGWRLPAMVDGKYVWGYNGTTTAGYNMTTSEMGHLFYESLGNKGYVATDGTYQPGFGLHNTGPFSNLLADSYWSGAEYSTNPDLAWYFYFGSGLQEIIFKYQPLYALAVRPGDVSPVPELVSIDIEPGKHRERINLHSRGEMTVAILSTSEFYAPDVVDKDSLTFGHTGDEDTLAFCYHRPEDVSGDGLKDLVCHFYTQDTGFQCRDTVGILKGKTVKGTQIKGSDSVKIVPCK